MAKHLHQSVAQYHKHCKKKYKFSKCPGDKRNKKPLISNKDVAVLVEYSKSFPSSRRRFFVLDLKKCQTTFKEFAVHGGKSSYKSPDHGSCRRSKKDKVVAKPIEIARKKVQTVKASTSNYGGLFGFLSGGASSSIDTEKEDFSYKKKYRRRSKYNGKLCSCKNPKGSRTDMTRPQFAVTRQLYKSTSSYSKSWGTIAYKKKSPMDGIMLNSLGEPYNGQYIDLIKPGVVLHEHKLIPNRKKLQAVGQGCPSVPRGRLRAILKRYGNRFASGTLIYMHALQCQ